MENLNWWAIVLAAVCSFLLGGPWYSAAMFGKVWNREAKNTEPPGSGHPPRCSA
jgi:hypothetical protein